MRWSTQRFLWSFGAWNSIGTPADGVDTVSDGKRGTVTRRGAQGGASLLYVGHVLPCVSSNLNQVLMSSSTVGLSITATTSTYSPRCAHWMHKQFFWPIVRPMFCVRCLFLLHVACALQKLCHNYFNSHVTFFGCGAVGGGQAVSRPLKSVKGLTPLNV